MTSNPLIRLISVCLVPARCPFVRQLASHLARFVLVRVFRSPDLPIPRSPDFYDVPALAPAPHAAWTAICQNFHWLSACRPLTETAGPRVRPAPLPPTE